MIQASDWLLRFLINPGYRIRRHVVLLLFSLVMVSVNFYIELFTEKNIPLSIGLGLILLVPIYLSVFVLTPRYLLHNRFGHYLASVMVVVLLSLLCSYFLQLDVNNDHFKNGEIWFSIVALLSSVVLLTMIIVGASSVVVFRHYVLSAQRIGKLENATMQSELEQLKNQINPHFLFNMLNNANVLIRENPPEAVRVLAKLKDLLKYQLKDSDSDQVRLEDDIRFLTDYLNMEKIRRDNFDFIISTEGDLLNVTLPPLLFIPFVENAVKHNNDNKILSYVHICFKLRGGDLTFICINSKPAKQKLKETDCGLGLANISRRLELLYDTGHTLKIDETEITFTIDLHLTLK